MTPGGRAAAAIEVLERWRDGPDGLDRVLAAWGRSHRFAGSGDRRAIADLVYDVVRRLRSAQWVGSNGASASCARTNPADGGFGAFAGRKALLGSLLLDGREPADFFGCGPHAPEPLDPQERRASEDALTSALDPVRFDLSDWLWPSLVDLPAAALKSLRQRAPLDLRVNRLKASPEDAATALAEEGVETIPGPLSADCLRVSAGARRVARTAAYLNGLVEIQDAASQAIAAIAPPEPGEVVLDYCAGGGGKTLALGALMQGRGTLIAHDASPERMAAIPERAARAGLSVTIADPASLGCSPRPVADLVYVDAPCSGSGAWRRNPDTKWRLTAADLDRFTALQGRVLREASGFVRPGGTLVYATCSILAAENDTVTERFLADTSDAWQILRRLHLLPGADAGDGFFAVAFRRS